MSPDRYASILNAVIETAKERGVAAPGSDYALACYQIIEAARSEAEVWGVDLQEIGLADFDAESLLSAPLKRAA
ncbi:hypothetical protein [Sphaerotilus microaerophilus]|jgi:hypothetical protein|uniref:Uncharacterized protein n=1 Tax=Sphaerotilus microaerophilus TaxID=2914710 RepID=A0ABM7YQJ8_9BURK|nr:hypothetical protein [Sphaerotilus sp. FB-5]BDI06821.1 hypothetical protein CATMQ487_37910 [Sphaerotilus sp. FB-5]